MSAAPVPVTAAVIDQMADRLVAALRTREPIAMPLGSSARPCASIWSPWQLHVLLLSSMAMV